MDAVIQCAVVGNLTMIGYRNGNVRMLDSSAPVSPWRGRAAPSIRACAVSPHATQFVVVPDDNDNAIVCIRCVVTGMLQHQLLHVPSPGAPADGSVWPTCCAFVCGGRLLLTGADDGRVRLWDTQSGMLRADALDGGHVIGGCACGRRSYWMAVTASWDGRVTVWHMDGLRQRLVLHAPDTTNMMSAHCCVSPDDEYIAATFCTGDVHVWEAGTGELRYTVTTSLRVPFHPAFSATDFLVVPAGDGCLCIHDAATGAYTCTLRFPVRSPVTATAFSDDGVWLTAGTVAGNYFMHNLTIVTQRRDRQRSVLIVIACGRRRGRPRLPGELWDWIFAERLL